MSAVAYDLLIRDGTVVTATETARCDIGVRGGRIVALGEDLAAGKTVIEADGRFVTPGGIDSHCHIEQMSAVGIMNADDFESATRSAALGGTTTVIPFACQHKGDDLAAITADYHARAARGAVVDYAFHLIVTDPTSKTMDDLSRLVPQGHGSIKIFLTYDAMRLDDEAVLDVLLKARELGALVMAHAENHGMIAWMVKRLLARGHTAPKFHAVSHPRASEAEAFTRLIAMAELIDQPVMIYHVATAEGAAVIANARGRGLKVYGETCPQYLFLTAADLDRPDGGKVICSPPLREAADQEALWAALQRGDLQTVTSDHAPFSYDAAGKLAAGPDATFKQIANGMPGLLWRLPLLFDAIVSQGRMDIRDFVRLTATAPAHIYNLADRKGAIAIGRDADLVIWDADRRVPLTDDLVADKTGYNPYAGRTLTGWPDTVVRRGEVIVSEGAMVAAPGSAAFLPRGGGEAARPRGVAAPEFDPVRNFGADLY
ncbi:MAG: dihydropyrimidinase [Pseudomonadota bacterium]